MASPEDSAFPLEFTLALCCNGTCDVWAVIISLVELNRPAPDFALPDLEGRLHRLSGFRGKIVIVNFWSADCPWVERVDQELLACLQEWGERVVLLTIAVNAAESDELVAASARTRGLPLVLRDQPQAASRPASPEEAVDSSPGRGGSARRVADVYQAQTTPHLFVMDPDGILRYAGAFDDVTFRHRTPTRFHLREAVEALLSGRLPDPVQPPAYGCAIVRHLPDSC